MREREKKELNLIKFFQSSFFEKSTRLGKFFHSKYLVIGLKIPVEKIDISYFFEMRFLSTKHRLTGFYFGKTSADSIGFSLIFILARAYMTFNFKCLY